MEEEIFVYTSSDDIVYHVGDRMSCMLNSSHEYILRDQIFIPRPGTKYNPNE